MVVRRRSVPLNKSMSFGAPPWRFSISTVRSMTARAFSELTPFEERPRRLRDLSASSRLPWRTSHQGDSGAKKTRISSGVYGSSATLHKCVAKCASYREDPLQGKRYPPGPMCLVGLVAFGGSSNNDTSNTPGHLQRRRDSATKSKRDNLTGVGGRVGNEEAPRHAFEGLADGENRKRVGL